MRSSHKRENIATKSKIYKKKRKKKSILNLYKDLTLRNNITMERLEYINEAIRIRKSSRGCCTGSWRLVPRDSCEVYKERRKRQAMSGKDEEGSFSDDSYCDCDSDYTTDRTHKKVRVKRHPDDVKKRGRRHRQRRRRSPSESKLSHTGSSTSATMSYASSTTDAEDDYIH